MLQEKVKIKWEELKEKKQEKKKTIKLKNIYKSFQCGSTDQSEKIPFCVFSVGGIVKADWTGHCHIAANPTEHSQSEPFQTVLHSGSVLPQS